MSRLSLPCLLAVAAAALPLSPVRQDGEVEIQLHTLAEGVAMITGQGGNMGLIHDDRMAVLIDDQFAPLSGSILSAIRQETNAPLRFVLNTHWHGDHTGGNLNMAAEGALIVAQDNVRRRMSTDQVMAALGRQVPASPAEALPVVTYPEQASVWVGKRRVELHHVPNAHTDGDSFVVIPDVNVLHLGDVFFNGMYPFIDTSSGGSMDGLIAAVERILPLCDGATRLIPGHGPLGGRADLVAYHDMLVGVRDAVARLIAEGADRDAVLAAHPTLPWDEQWGHGFMAPDRFTGIVADSLLAR